MEWNGFISVFSMNNEVEWNGCVSMFGWWNGME